MTIVFISCVKTKSDKPCLAKDMYQSTLFKYSLRYARKLTTDDKIYILSAKYGVLPLNKHISPYELTLNTFTTRKKKIWAFKCYQQLEALNVNFKEKAYFLCGENYRKYLMQKFP